MEEDEEGIKPSISPEPFTALRRECHVTYRKVWNCEAPAVRMTNQGTGQAFKTSAVKFKLVVQTKLKRMEGKQWNTGNKGAGAVEWAVTPTGHCKTEGTAV